MEYKVNTPECVGCVYLSFSPFSNNVNGFFSILQKYFKKLLKKNNG